MSSKSWGAYYESLAIQATTELLQLNLKRSNQLQDRGHESNIQYIVVEYRTFSNMNFLMH